MFQCYESFKTPKTGRTSANLYLQLKWDLTDYENHRFNVRTAKPCIDNGAPLTYSHLYYRPKKLQLELERFCAIQRNNKHLMEKVARIQREGAWVDNKNYHEIKSLNIWRRQKEMIELAYNNQTMLNRLLDCTSYYNRNKIEDEYLLNQKYKANVQRYPKNWRNILQQIKLLQKMIKNKVISERTGKYIPGLKRRKNKWALEREAFQIEKAQKAVQEDAIEAEEKERVTERALKAKERLEHKKEYEEASKKWREAREERLRLAKQREQEAKERESEEKHQVSEKLRQRRQKVKRELELKREEKARKDELDTLEKKKRESEEYHRESEKTRQRREKAKQELEEWRKQKKAREAERKALEKKEDKPKSNTGQGTTFKQRRGQLKSKTKISNTKEPDMSGKTRKKVQGERKPLKKGKEGSQLTINGREQAEDLENKMRKEAGLKELGLRTERRKSSKEEEGEEEKTTEPQVSWETRKRLLGERRSSSKGKEDNKFTINGKGQTEDLENKIRKEEELKKLRLRTERRKYLKGEEDVMKWNRDIRESLDDKRRHTLDRSKVEETKMKPRGSVSVEKVKEIDESEFDSDSQNLMDDYSLEAPEDRKRSKDSKTLEDEQREPQISEGREEQIREQAEDLKNKIRKEVELKKLGLRTERRKSSKEEDDVMKWSRDIRESVDDKRRYTLDRSRVEETKMIPRRSISVEKVKEIDESEFDSDSQDLTDDDSPEVHEARERSKDSKTLEDELRELQISDGLGEQKRKVGINEEELLNERDGTKTDKKLGERKSEQIKIKLDERKLLDEIVNDPKSETNRHELTKKQHYQMRDMLEESVDDKRHHTLDRSVEETKMKPRGSISAEKVKETDDSEFDSDSRDLTDDFSLEAPEARERSKDSETLEDELREVQISEGLGEQKRKSGINEKKLLNERAETKSDKKFGERESEQVKIKSGERKLLDEIVEDPKSEANRRELTKKQRYQMRDIIEESVDDKRHHTLDRSKVEETKMKPRGSISAEKVKETDDSEFDSDSRDLTDDFSLEAPEARERSKDSETLEDELREVQISDGPGEQKKKLGIKEEELLHERAETKSDKKLGERKSEQIKIKLDERKLLDEIVKDPKSETNRRERNKEEQYQIRDTIEELPEIPKKSLGSITDKDQPFSKSSESRSEEAGKCKKASDDNKEESKGKKDDNKDEETKGEDRDDKKNEGANGKKGDDKKAAEQKKIPSEEDISEDLGKTNLISEEGKVEETDLAKAKVESEKEALRDAHAEDMESPKLTDEEAPKDLGTAYIKTDKGKVEEVNIVEVEDEGDEGALLDPDDIKRTKDIESEDADDLGSVFVLTDKGTLERINLGKDKKEVERENSRKSTEKAATQKEKGSREHSEDDDDEESAPETTSRKIHVFGQRGSVEQIVLDEGRISPSKRQQKKGKGSQQTKGERSGGESDKEKD